MSMFKVGQLVRTNNEWLNRYVLGADRETLWCLGVIVGAETRVFGWYEVQLLCPRHAANRPYKMSVMDLCEV